MADRYWVASSAGNWNDTANWSTASGGAGGSSVPDEDDHAYFNGDATADCTISAATGCGSLTTTGYTGEFIFTAGGYLWQPLLDSGSYTFSACTVDASARASYWLWVRGTNAVDIGGLTINSAVTISGNASGYVLFDAYARTSGKIADDVKYRNSVASAYLETIGDLEITGDFSMWGAFANAWTFDNSGDHDLTFGGDIDMDDITWTKGTGTITLNGASQSINLDAQAVEDMDIDVSGTVTLTATVDPDTLTLTAGTLDFNGQNVETVGNFTMAAGTTVTE